MDAVVYLKCNDSDRQESITRSGINTSNLRITDEAGQIRQTGLTAEETRAKVSTGTTTESAQADAGSLHNRFDKDRVENEINLQRNVSQNFGHNVQQANGEINRHLDHLKEQLQQGKISQAKYDRQITLWQRGQVLLNSIASGLSAPTQSGAGIAANAVSPAVSYQIGQYFKELAANNRDGQLSAGQEAAHILAHTVWGAAVAHAGGNNALAGALAAGGPEAAAPIISHYLYQERDGSRLSAEQKETVTAITSLIGTAAGAALGNTPADAAQGSLNAKNAVENNYLTDKQAVDLYTELKNCQDNVSCQNDIFDEYRRKSAINRQLLDAICADNADSVVCHRHIEQIAMGGNTEIFDNPDIYYLSAPWKESADDFVITETRNSLDKYFMGNEASSTHATKGTSPGRNLSNIHIGKPMEDTASSINLSNPFSEYYRIVFNEQQRNFIEQTGKSAGTAVLKTLLEPALEVSDLTNAGRNIILGRNEYPTNMSALGEHVQQGAGTGKALLFVGQNVALTAIGARFPKISIGAGTLYGSHTIVSGIQENNPEKTGEGIAVFGGSTLGGYTYGLGRRFKIE